LSESAAQNVLCLGKLAPPAQGNAEIDGVRRLIGLEVPRRTQKRDRFVDPVDLLQYRAQIGHGTGIGGSNLQRSRIGGRGLLETSAALQTIAQVIQRGESSGCNSTARS
jgi:hypothetical protein